MIILSRGSLTKTGMFVPDTMSLNLSERGSTATLTMAIGTASLSVGDWLQDDTEPGAGIVWRVKTIDTQYNTNTVTVQLEDMVNSLSDQILNGQITPEDIAGTGATTCTAQAAIQYILNKQSIWTLDSFDFSSVSNPYNFNGDTLKAAIDSVSASLTDPVWSYDFTTYPFKLSIKQESSAIDSEMRMSRNISTLKVSVDRSRMYTRFYPIGKNNLRLESPGYVEKNVSTWGVIEKTETDETQDTTDKLTEWANERLNGHAEPVVTVTVGGLDLSDMTGVDLDHFTIGKKCRVPLPEYSTTITEKVIKLSWRDKIHEPENVTVTLANQKEDIASIVNKLKNSGGRSGRANAKQKEEDHAWFVDTTDHVSMVAEAVAGKDGEGKPNWSRVSELTVDGHGIDARVTEAEGAIVENTAAIEMTASSISLSVSAAKSEVYTSIEQTASGIHTEIVNTQSGLRAYVDQTASYFRQTYVSNTNKTWIQDTDPTAGGAEPKEGDVWVESTSHGTWDGAEGFDWEHDEDYDWLQVQGAKIWGWKNDKWELVSDQQQVVSMTDVEQTSEHIVHRAIRALVNDDGNLSVYRAELLVEGDRIRSYVNERITGMGSTLEQTASAIRSEVHAAQSSLYSFIMQTASQITIRVGESNMVFSGMDKPEGTEDHPLVEGDLWIKSTFQRTWEDMEELDAWVDDEDFDWGDLKGSKLYVYDAELGDFKEALDETALAQDTDIDENSERIKLVARSVKKVDGKVDVFRAELNVKADKIESRVNQRIENLGSTITQTAREIRAEVHAANSQVYSAISQTASSIRAEVVDSLNDVNSSITQTASAIRAEVNASNSQIYSSITQTASQIRSEVASSVSGLQSSITQNADSIALVVDGNGIKSASIVAAINDGESSVIISASHINLNGYVKATDITADYVATKLALASNVNAKKLTLTNNGYIVLPTGDGNVNITGGTFVDVIRGLKVVSSGNNYKLQAITYGEADWHDLPNSTFSRAVSSFVTGGGNGYVNVTALPQNQTKSVKVSIDGQASISSNGTYTYGVDFENADGDDVPTGATKSVTVNVVPTKAQIGASRGSRETQEPTADATLSGVTANGWYVITVSVLGRTKTYKIEVDV